MAGARAASTTQRPGAPVQTNGHSSVHVRVGRRSFEGLLVSDTADAGQSSTAGSLGIRDSVAAIRGTRK